MLFATAWILWYLWVNSQMRIFSGVRVLILVGRRGGSHGFRVEFFVFRRSAISSARAVGGVEKGTKGKKGDAFTYIEVFKRLIASGDAMTR